MPRPRVATKRESATASRVPATSASKSSGVRCLRLHLRLRSHGNAWRLSEERGSSVGGPCTSAVCRCRRQSSSAPLTAAASCQQRRRASASCSCAAIAAGWFGRVSVAKLAAAASACASRVSALRQSHSSSAAAASAGVPRPCQAPHSRVRSPRRQNRHGTLQRCDSGMNPRLHAANLSRRRAHRGCVRRAPRGYSDRPCRARASAGRRRRRPE